MNERTHIAIPAVPNDTHQAGTLKMSDSFRGRYVPATCFDTPLATMLPYKLRSMNTIIYIQFIVVVVNVYFKTAPH